MKKFWGYVSNNEFSIGCTGQTVYLYDKNDTEIKKFKDITYAYTPMISPNGEIFVVKSTDGRLAIYSLKTLSLIKKFRFSKVNGSQDDGFCFSPDGQFFINIERQTDALHSDISVYNTSDFSLTNRIVIDNNVMLEHIEYDKSTDSYYVLGFLRNESGIISNGFVGKLKDNQIKELITLPKNEYSFFRSYKALQLHGFTEMKYKWTHIDGELENLATLDYTLAKLFKSIKAE